jgi:hypothetical protein
MEFINYVTFDCKHMLIHLRSFRGDRDCRGGSRSFDIMKQLRASDKDTQVSCVQGSRLCSAKKRQTILCDWPR